MATACYIKNYESYSDRGAFVQKSPLKERWIDEKEIVVGEKLPWWNKYDAPVVKIYNGQQLVLEFKGETFSIRVGEEVLLDEGILSQEYGVTCFSLDTVKVISTEFKYKGQWQSGSTIMQKLKGPIGDGEVWCPNGDHFKGFFHLNYAHISGPAYAAEGCYTFADGSYIENAWINTSSDRKTFNLNGVFRIHHPEGPDSIAMFCNGGRKYGMELLLDEDNPRVKEWWANEEMIYWAGPDERGEIVVKDYAIDETSKKDCLTLKLTVMVDGKTYRIEQKGGRYTENQYGSYYYDPYTHSTLWLPNGDIIEHYGFGVRSFQPYDGYIDMHCAETGMYRTEVWKRGELMDDEKWKRDNMAAKSVMLPEPSGGDEEIPALVWKDNHIEYMYGEWIYDGKIKDDRPEGQGVLVGFRSNEGRRYEGLFRNGQFVDPKAFEGEIRLHARSGHSSWSISGDGEWEYEESDFIVKLGRMSFSGFRSYKVTKISSDCITISCYEDTYKLKRGESLTLRESIDGDERSDGCVYDGDYYSLVLTWTE